MQLSLFGRLVIVCLTFGGSGCKKLFPEAGAEAAPVVPAQPVANPPARKPPGPPTCGESGQPDCPLQIWMDSKANALVTMRKAPELSLAMRELASFAPDGYVDWANFAVTAAQAAEANDFDLVKRACQACHDDYRKRYRAELRARPLLRPSSGLPAAGD